MKTFTVFVTLLAMVALAAQPTRSQDSASEADAVKRVIEAATVAINAEKLDELLALYAEDARIDSKVTKSIVSKAQYGDAMKRSFAQRSVPRVQTGGLRVSMIDSSHATVEGVVYFSFTSGPKSDKSSTSGRPSYKRQWKLEKRDGRWLIVEAKYL